MTNRKERQEGSILLLALVFVLMLSLIAASVVQTATLELHMAGNDQFREEAGQLAKAIAAELSVNPAHFSLATPVGSVNCAPASPDPGCNSWSLGVPDSGQGTSGYTLDYRVTRTAPLRWVDYPLPHSAGTSDEEALHEVAIFEVEVRVDGRQHRRGAAHVIQGVAVRIPPDPVTEAGEAAALSPPPAVAASDLYRVYWREPGRDPL